MDYTIYDNTINLFDPNRSRKEIEQNLITFSDTSSIVFSNSNIRIDEGPELFPTGSQSAFYSSITRNQTEYTGSFNVAGNDNIRPIQPITAAATYQEGIRKSYIDNLRYDIRSLPNTKVYGGNGLQDGFDGTISEGIYQISSNNQKPWHVSLDYTWLHNHVSHFDFEDPDLLPLMRPLPNYIVGEYYEDDNNKELSGNYKINLVRTKSTIPRQLATFAEIYDLNPTIFIDLQSVFS